MKLNISFLTLIGETTCLYTWKNNITLLIIIKNSIVGKIFSRISSS